MARPLTAKDIEAEVATVEATRRALGARLMVFQDAPYARRRLVGEPATYLVESSQGGAMHRVKKRRK